MKPIPFRWLAFGLLVSLLALSESLAQAQTSWKGTVSTDWTAAGNWTAGVPNSTLDAIIGDFIAERTQAENVTFFEEAEVTIGPVFDISQIVEDPHAIERELVVDFPDSDMDALPMHNVPARFLGTPASIRTAAPRIGQHNRELLAEVGVGDEEYDKLRASGLATEGDLTGKAVP